MDNDKVIFLKVIKDYLNGEKHEYQISEKCLRYILFHELEAIFYNQTGASALKRKYLYCLYISKIRNELLNEMNEMGFAYYIVKGPVLAQFYPDPALRTMGDVDIIVQKQDKNRIKKILIDHEYVFDKHESLNEWHFSNRGCEFELHHSLLYEDCINNQYLHVFDHVWDEVNNHQLTKETHFIFVLMHLRTHLLNHGAGFRQFMDLALFSRQQLDWVFIVNKLKELKLYDFSGTIFGFIAKWWDVTCPLTKAIEDSFYEKATDAIFNNGIFGFNDTANEKNVSINQKQNRSLLSYILNRIFLPYSFFELHLKEYPFMDKRKYLLPLGWFIHGIHVLKRCYKYKNYLKDKLPDRSAIEYRNKILHRWRLK